MMLESIALFPKKRYNQRADMHGRRGDTMAKVLVIGGGAAGMAAAIAAASVGDEVTVLERMDRVGKKILATGNGRCNLMNVSPLKYPGGEAFARRVLAHCGVREQTAFWHHLGLRMRTEDGGRVYPVCVQASSVLDALRMMIDALCVSVVASVTVDRVEKTRAGYAVFAGHQRWNAERLIVTGGGCAQPKLGSNGSLWPILASLGHTIRQPFPCLTQIVTDTAPIRGLSGIRVRCRVWVTRNEQNVHEESGEALFADYGVSGVCVMQCARYALKGSKLHLSLLEGMGFRDAGEAENEIHRRISLWGDKPCETLLTGLCVTRLTQSVFRMAGLDEMLHKPISALTLRHVKALAAVLSDFSLMIQGVKGFENAQVSGGGADCEEFDPTNMMSRICDNLHAAGEVLDVDGDCGGFNLMFAFGSGILAGLHGRKAPWLAE